MELCLTTKLSIQIIENNKQISSLSQPFQFPDVTSRRQCMTSGWGIIDMSEGKGGWVYVITGYLHHRTLELIFWFLKKWLILYLDAGGSIATSQFHGPWLFPELRLLSVSSPCSPCVCVGLLWTLVSSPFPKTCWLMDWTWGVNVWHLELTCVMGDPTTSWQL